jgi:hypothetical protein
MQLRLPLRTSLEILVRRPVLTWFRRPRGILRRNSYELINIGARGGRLTGSSRSVATLTEPRYRTMGKFIWPGSGVTFLLFLLLHANYFGHPLLITCFDSFFNALLYTGIAAALRRLLQWVAKQFEHCSRWLRAASRSSVAGDQQWSLLVCRPFENNASSPLSLGRTLSHHREEFPLFRQRLPVPLLLSFSTFELVARRDCLDTSCR